MIRISYKELALTRQDFERMAQTLGLEIPSNSWLNCAYETVQKLAEVYGDEVRRNGLLKNERRDRKVFYALQDINILSDVLPYITTQDTGTLKKKITKLL